MKNRLSLTLSFCMVVILMQAAHAIPPTDIENIIRGISKENVEIILKKMESFQTRHVFSTDREGFGIKASADWIHEKFSSSSPKLKVFFDDYELPPQGRINQDVTMRNVVAVLPGRLSGDQERIFLINAHYDSYARKTDDQFPRESNDNPATGVNDDSSGVAALIEMARVMSGYEFDASVYFAAFAGEEVGLVGSTLMAARLKEEGKTIAGVITLDMIGNIEGGSGLIDNKRMRVFSAGPADSPSRQLARYAKNIGEKYFPSAEIDCIFRADRFGRGGDHTPFVLEGWPGIRMMEANENYSRQHTTNDTLDNMDLDYCTRNIRIVSSILASLASAPPSPSIISERGRALLGRGEDGYSAQLRWNPVSSENLTGYKVYWRKTTAPFWENEVFVGDVSEYILEKITIDEYVFGVSSVGRDGNESPINAYTMPPRSKSTYTLK
ncbi:MAG: M28 family peptidase [Candidatus Aminicenantes bacterium]|nr:M28 family peptidase [Candidatus Aminicenantes bacterium]